MKIAIAHSEYYTWDGEINGGNFTALLVADGTESVIAVADSFSELKSMLNSEYLAGFGSLDDGVEIGEKSFTREALNDEIVF